MADSTANIQLTSGVWQDLYALSGITVGVAIEVINVGNSECRLYAGVTPPALANEGIPLPVYDIAVNDSGDTGAWIYCTQPGRVNVRVA